MLRNTLFLTTAWTLLFAANQTANAQKEKIEFLAGDTADFAAENAPQIAAMMRPLLKVYNLEQPNIVVLPFSNEDGDVTLDTAETLVSLQGELISALKKEKLGVVLDLKDIKRSFSRSKVNPADINPVTKKAATAAMNKMEWHCCVTGSFDIKDTGDAKLNFSKRKALKLALNLIYAAADAGANNNNSNNNNNNSNNNNANNNNGGNNNGVITVNQNELPVNPGIVTPPSTPSISGRFDVSLICDGKPLNLMIDKTPSSLFHNAFFVELDPGMLGKEYKVVMKCTGNIPTGPPSGYYNPNTNLEENRVFGAALLVDGVDSFAHPNGLTKRDGTPQFSLQACHSKNAIRWLLTKPAKVIRPNPSNPNGFDVVYGANGQDHSIRPVPGFQMDGKTAASFTFAETGSGATAAEMVGTTNDIGMIAVHFYQQKLPGDKKNASAGVNKAGTVGTKPGRPQKHGVYKVKVDFHNSPVESWRIFYRTKGTKPPVPTQNLVPYAGI